jgi:hypothetical protein
MRRLITLGLLFSLLTLALLTAPTTPKSSAQVNTELQYAAKFVCGRTDGGLAAPGQYFTIVNVHNPSPNRTAEFRKKFARALPDEKAGRITPFFPAALRADQAMAIDCPNIYEHTGIAPGTFIEGYVVIHTRMELDVVAVYTAGHSEVETLHTERVPFRRVPVPPPCGALNLSLNTGTAGWRITSDPDNTTTEPRAANVISPWQTWGLLSGSSWIGPNLTAGTEGGEPGDYIYELAFCLCSDFSNAQLTVTGLADNSAKVYLNGSLLTTFPGFSGSGTSASASGPFVGGINQVKVELNNIGSQTGLDLTGTVTATAGRCPPGVSQQFSDSVFPDRIRPTPTPSPRRRP